MSRRLTAALVIGSSALAAVTCGEVARTGRSPSFVIIEVVEAASGATPDRFGTFLQSDVQTFVRRQIGTEQVLVPTIFNDLGRATFRLGIKNPGTPTAPLGPTQLNEVTLTRYRVRFIRADGRNTPGVDVPHGFDGGFTVTVPTQGSIQGGFDLVRHTMKEEPPLRNLVAGGGANIINTIAEITFFGRDQAGNDVMVVAQITVNFGDFGDPA